MATMKVHEINLDRDSENGDTPLYVNLANGTQLVIWASGNSLSVRVPMYDGQPHRNAEEIDITLPVAEDIGTQCDQTDREGNFHVTATHRH